MTTRRKTTGAKPAKAVEQTIETAQETVETAVKASQEAVSGNYEKAYSMMNDQFDVYGKKFFESFEDAAQFNKDNMDALVASSTAWGKGVETFSKNWFDFLKKTAEDNVSATKSIMAAKSVREAVDLQSNYAKSAYEAYVAEGNKLSELGINLANEAGAPIAARFKTTVEKFGKAA